MIALSHVMLTEPQWVEAITMFAVFPLVAMYFRRFKYPSWLDNTKSFHNIPKRYSLNIFRYGFPVLLTWIARKMVMNYYTYKETI